MNQRVAIIGMDCIGANQFAVDYGMATGLAEGIGARNEMLSSQGLLRPFSLARRFPEASDIPVLAFFGKSGTVAKAATFETFET